jgi:hypothetical protein
MKVNWFYDKVQVKLGASSSGDLNCGTNVLVFGAEVWLMTARGFGIFNPGLFP